MAEFKTLYPDIKLEVEGCPVSVIDRAIIQTLRHFCRETYYWQYEIEPITLLQYVEEAPQTYLYTFEKPLESEILAIDELIMDGRTLVQKSDAWLDEKMRSWRKDYGTPQYYIHLPDDRVRFVPASKNLVPIAVTGRIVLTPTRDAKSFGDQLLDFEYGISAGVISRLMSMAKPWANGQRGQIARADYLDAISEAKAKVIQRFSDGVETIYQRSWLL